MRKLFPWIVRILLIALAVFVTSSAYSWRKWEYVNPGDIEIKIIPNKAEVIAGEDAVFTIQVRNKTDKPVQLDFSTGQRWDMAAFHQGNQIWRWSNFLKWEESNNSITVYPDKPLTQEMVWKTRDRQGAPLPKDVYRVQGMVMCSNRNLVSNLADIRLLPNHQKDLETIKVLLYKTFEIELPRFTGYRKIYWKVAYDYNDNRIEHIASLSGEKAMTYQFRALRPGHVIMRLYAFPEYKSTEEAIERRNVRIEVTNYD
ncbi:MAG: hypothetical protein HQM10_09265 [Candidatus Riflebacteria bacterium]|nr:hypothetical protein [Candidatus Riflebacteria bacterium]